MRATAPPTVAVVNPLFHFALSSKFGRIATSAPLAPQTHSTMPMDHLTRHSFAWSQLERVARNNPAKAASSSYFKRLVAQCAACDINVSRTATIYRARIHPLGFELASDPLPVSLVSAPPREVGAVGRLNAAGDYCFYAAL